MAEIKKTIKKTTTKTTAKPVVKVVVKKPVVVKENVAKVSLKVKVFDVAGKETGSIALPEAIFGVKPNKTLLAQAVRVYLANQRQEMHLQRQEVKWQGLEKRFGSKKEQGEHDMGL